MAERSLSWRHLLVAAMAGAGAMYWLDPDRGRRRRAILRDKLASGASRIGRASRGALQDARSRAGGIVAETRRALREDRDGDELRLIERVRARLGRVVGNPGAIQVGAQGGRIIVSGPVLRQNADALLSAARAVPGVHEIDDHLVRHDDAGSVPGLQGAATRLRLRALRARRLSPAVRGAAMAGGAALIVVAMRRSPLVRLAIAAGGMALARSASGGGARATSGVRDTGESRHAGGRPEPNAPRDTAAVSAGTM